MCNDDDDNNDDNVEFDCSFTRLSWLANWKKKLNNVSICWNAFQIYCGDLISSLQFNWHLTLSILYIVRSHQVFFSSRAPLTHIFISLFFLLFFLFLAVKIHERKWQTFTLSISLGIETIQSAGNEKLHCSRFSVNRSIHLLLLLCFHWTASKCPWINDGK